jgi:uncharacterized protein (DUF58 family)
MIPTGDLPRRSHRRIGARLAAATTYDFCPEFSQRVRRAAYHPLGLLLFAAGVAALCGLAVHPRVFALAGGLLAVAAAGVCWPWVTVRGVRTEVGFDRERAVEGAEVGAAAAVTNHLPWPAWGLMLRDTSGGSTVRFPAIGGRSRGRYQWVFVPPSRGEYPVGVPTIVTGFPFGVWEASRPAAVERRLLVWPRTYPVGPVPAVGGEDADVGMPSRRVTGGVGEVVGVRPYRRGDSPRRIHWPQTAKHDRLVVCELQPTARPAVLVVLDTDSSIHTSGLDGTFEWAVRVAASLARGWLEAGAAVGLAWADSVIPVSAGTAQATRVMDALARLSAGSRPLAEVLAAPAVRAARVGVRVAVTTEAGTLPIRPASGVRCVVLWRNGFAGGESIDSIRLPVRPWLAIPSAADIPHQLRHGTTEAIHGS